MKKNKYFFLNKNNNFFFNNFNTLYLKRKIKLKWVPFYVVRKKNPQ